MSKLEEKIRKLLKDIQSPNIGNKRGAEFELTALLNIRWRNLLRMQIDFKVPNIAPKDIDFFFEKINIGMELLAPSRQAAPLVDTDGLTEEQMLHKFNSAMRQGDFRARDLVMLVNTKIREKNLIRSESPVILLFDLTYSDVFEDYFGDREEDRFCSLRDDFIGIFAANPIQISNLPPNEWLAAPKISVALVIRKKYKIKKIFLLSRDVPENKRLLLKIFGSKIPVYS